MYDQLNIFDITLPDFKIDKPIRLIELFAGIGSQAMALRDLGGQILNITGRWSLIDLP